MPDNNVSQFVIAVDPGTRKCGIALLDPSGDVISKGIVPRDQILEKVSELLVGRSGVSVVVGASTQGTKVAGEIFRGSDINPHMVDETDSSMLARELYWNENRAGCMWSIFPASFRPLPRPIDDYAAMVIGRRFLQGRRKDAHPGENR